MFRIVDDLPQTHAVLVSAVSDLAHSSVTDATGRIVDDTSEGLVIEDAETIEAGAPVVVNGNVDFNLANVALVLVFLASVTPLTFAQLWGFLFTRVCEAYVGIANAAVAAFKWTVSLCSRT